MTFKAAEEKPGWLVGSYRPYFTEMIEREMASTCTMIARPMAAAVVTQTNILRSHNSNTTASEGRLVTGSTVEQMGMSTTGDRERVEEREGGERD